MSLSPPLAETLRPKSLDHLFGQDLLLEEGSLIEKSLKAKKPLSFLLWGPPGCGKTSLARLYATSFSMRFRQISAVSGSIQELKKAVQEEISAPLFQKGLLIFVDEIHRFNKAQQDALLPYLEDGTFYLVGATTENPSFYLNSALLSRLRVLEMKPLSEEALEKLLQRFEKEVETLPLTPEARALLIHQSAGDGRFLFNMIESLQPFEKEEAIDEKELSKRLSRRPAHFDRAGDQHYNLVSALHKAVRGSDVDGALYWFARMLEGGEEPLFIARRLIRMASEDIGLADPDALKLATAAKEAYQMLGSPEGELALAEVVVYLALAPKSNALYLAYKAARMAASKSSEQPPPKHILNAPTKMMKELGYGKGYVYDHDLPNAFSGQDFFPEEVERESFYEPVERGFEREMKKRLEYFKRLRSQESPHNTPK